MWLPPEAVQQGGLFTHAQARAAGLTPRALARAVRSGLIKVTARGIYGAVADLDDPIAAQATLVRAAQLGGAGRWYASRRSAALLMGLPLIGRPPRVAQMARDGSRQGAQGKSRHRRVTPLPGSDTWEYGGIAMTTPARTVADIARSECFRNGVVVADAALRRGMPREELSAVLARMASWPGVRRARQVLEFADGRSESPGESVTRAVAGKVEGIPALLPQVEVYLDGSFVARLDLLCEEALLAVEFDGRIKFTGERVMPALLLRQERIRDAGIDVMRTHWDEVFGDPQGFQRRLRERVAERGARALRPNVTLRQAPLRYELPLLGSPHDGLAA